MTKSEMDAVELRAVAWLSDSDLGPYRRHTAALVSDLLRALRSERNRTERESQK